MILITSAIFIRLLTIRSPMLTRLIVILLSLIVGFNIQINLFSWFGFIIFLLYVGGILVVFLYFSSLLPNQKPLSILRPLVFTISLLLFSFLPSLKAKAITIPSSGVENIILYSNNSYPLRLFIIVFLLILLIIVVKLTHNSKIPLRPII